MRLFFFCTASVKGVGGRKESLWLRCLGKCSPSTHFYWEFCPGCCKLLPGGQYVEANVLEPFWFKKNPLADRTCTYWQWIVCTLVIIQRDLGTLFWHVVTITNDNSILTEYPAKPHACTTKKIALWREHVVSVLFFHCGTHVFPLEFLLLYDKINTIGVCYRVILTQLGYYGTDWKNTEINTLTLVKNTNYSK